MVLRLPMAAIVASLLAASPAAAAPPPNDARANPTPLSQPPTSVSGSTAGSTIEPNDPFACTRSDGTLWYRLSGADAGRLVLRFTAEGDLDAAVAVFRGVRSQVSAPA